MKALETDSFDVLVIGAGPTGMACAIDAQRAGFRAALLDKGCLCNSLFHYPSHMTFFTTSELLEIGDIPFPSPNAKPTRNEALEYYRKVAMHYRLDVRPYQRVESVTAGEVVGLAAELFAPEGLSAGGIGPSEERFREAIERVNPGALAQAA